MRYALFGTGRVGASMAAYLRALGHETVVVSRSESEARAPALKAVAQADAVMAAIPDAALHGWRRDFAEALAGKPAVHFSGATLLDGLWSYHPLYSFPRTPLEHATMARIAFARQAGAPPLSELLPGAANPEFVIRDEDRAFYHALAVLSGNFASFIWNEAARAMADRLDLAPERVLASYLAGAVEEFRASPFDSLTGPVARRDRGTVEANLAALAGEPQLAALYRAFLAAAWPDYQDGA